MRHRESWNDRRRRPPRPRRGGVLRLIRNVLFTAVGLVALFYLFVLITGWIG